MTLKQVTLWSFLNQSNAKREIVCPDGLRVSIEEFAEELKAQLKENQLPASAELVVVNWDDTNTTQKLILVRYVGNQAPTNVLQYSVGLEQLGKFAYLEKRVFLEPPRLPTLMEVKEYLEYEDPEDEESNGKLKASGCSISLGISVLIPIAAWIISIVWEISPVVGIALGIITIVLTGLTVNHFFSRKAERQALVERNIELEERNNEIEKLNNEIHRWNLQKEKNDLERQSAVEQWHKNILKVAYLSQTSDFFGRWTSAVSTTIDQVVQKLFIDRHAQAQKWQEEKTSQEEIEKELKRRNAEMFG